MKDTLRLDELIGWAGMFASGSFPDTIGGPVPGVSTYPRPDPPDVVS